MPLPYRHLTARPLASQVSVHLASFTLGSADLSKQAATVPCMTPELNIARMRVLEYFNAQSISGKQSIFTWENGPILNAATLLWLERSCAPRALPKDHSSKQRYLVSDTELLIKNFPEFECYRDVAFYCKFFLNKDIKAFPSGKELTQKDARLQFQSMEGTSETPNAFLVRGFGSILHCKALLRPARHGNEQQLPPTARFGCMSAPSIYAFPHLLETEDDVLHTVDLPSFASTDQSGHALGQHDAELLLSFLTVPYLRIPLVVSFFASDDRIHSLQAPKLQQLLDAALFEPGEHLHASLADEVPSMVPSLEPTLLGTSHHLLLNELRRSPDTLLRSVIALAEQAAALDTGSPRSSTATIIMCPMPNAQCPINNAQCLMSNAQRPMPNVQCPMPTAHCPMPNAQCPMPNANTSNAPIR